MSQEPSKPNKTILFVAENDPKEILETLKIDDTSKLKDILSAALKATYNNYVGYYLFRDRNSYYQIFFLPKTIRVPDDESSYEDTIKNFIAYLSEYYRLKAKYRLGNMHISLPSYTEFSIEAPIGKQNTYSIENFLFYRYITILQNIKSFFKKHKSFVRITRRYAAQTIKHKFDLLENIREPNKTKIHQIKTEEIVYSEIANITYGAIKLFIKNKIYFIENEKEKNILLGLSVEIKNMLLKKFKVDSSYKTTLPQLLSTSTHKSFRKKHSHSQLFMDILGLFGAEHFFEEDNKSSRYHIQSESLFFDPKSMYEWYVYDKFVSLLDENKYNIKFEGLKETKINYELKTEYQNGCEKQEKGGNKQEKEEGGCVVSKPDFVIETENKLFVVDVKWKRRNKRRDESFELSDILKLKRDCELRRNNKKLHAILVFPETKESFFEEFLYGKSNPSFSFYSRQIGFDDRNIFDFTKIEEEALPAVDRSLVESLVSSPKKIASVLENTDINEHDIEEIISSHLSENVKILHHEILKEYRMIDILDDPFCHPLRDFLSENRDTLEEECREFIHSSASSMFYFQKHSADSYDYSLPASGLWKSIEVELNASVIFLLRYEAKICDSLFYNKYKEGGPNTIIQTGEKRNQAVFLKSRKKGSVELNNIMLGSFPHLFKNIYAKTYDDGTMKKAFSPFCTDHDSIENWAKNIASFLFDILAVRNPHTHKDLMTSEQFDSFLEIVFKNDSFNFYHLVELKKQILSHIRKENTA